MRALKDLVNSEYDFYSYKQGIFIYKARKDRIFLRILAEEIGDAQLQPIEKGIALMKWIRQYLDALKEAE